jgi:hypothetical protein
MQTATADVLQGRVPSNGRMGENTDRRAHREERLHICSDPPAHPSLPSLFVISFFFVRSRMLPVVWVPLATT